MATTRELESEVRELSGKVTTLLETVRHLEQGAKDERDARRSLDLRVWGIYGVQILGVCAQVYLALRGPSSPAAPTAVPVIDGMWRLLTALIGG